MRLTRAAIELGGAATLDLDFAHAGRNVSLALPENLTIDSTAAVDSLQMGFIPNNTRTSFKKSDEPDFYLDFLTSRGRTQDAPIHIARLGLTMQPLRFMELSLEDPMRCTLLAKNGPIVVNMPRPQRYAVHKLLVYGDCVMIKTPPRRLGGAWIWCAAPRCTNSPHSLNLDHLDLQPAYSFRL